MFWPPPPWLGIVPPPGPHSSWHGPSSVQNKNTVYLMTYIYVYICLIHCYDALWMQVQEPAIFHRHWTLHGEPASVVCDEWAGWLILFCEPTEEPALATPSIRKWKRGDLEQMKLNGPGRWKLEVKKFLAVGEACMAIFWPTPGFKEPSAGLGSQQRGLLFLPPQCTQMQVVLALGV